MAVVRCGREMHMIITEGSTWQGGSKGGDIQGTEVTGECAESMLHIDFSVPVMLHAETRRCLA
jgi:hypothetical protein